VNKTSTKPPAVLLHASHTSCSLHMKSQSCAEACAATDVSDGESGNRKQGKSRRTLEGLSLLDPVHLSFHGCPVPFWTVHCWFWVVIRAHLQRENKDTAVRNCSSVHKAARHALCSLRAMENSLPLMLLHTFPSAQHSFQL